jgi:hypothetical protein
LATDWVEKVNTTAQEHVAEPVVAAGILQPAGTWGAFGLEQVSGAAAMFKRRKVNKDAGGLASSSWKGTKTALLAVTADKLYAFSCKQKGRSGWKIREQLGVWDRSDLRVEMTPGKLATKVVFDHLPIGALRTRGHDGQHRELQRAVPRRDRLIPPARLRTFRCGRSGSSRRTSR